MNKSEILQQFLNRPYLVRMGAKKVAFRLGSTIKAVKEARYNYHQNRKIKIGSLPKILIFDLETAPMKAFVWSRWKQDISLSQTISEWFIICWSAKWLYGNDTFGDCLTSDEILNEDDKRITISLYNAINQADIVIAHNARRFDVPKANSRFIMHELPPCSSYKIIDTLEISKKVFGFSSNKLDALATYFKIPNKLNTNFELWSNCLQGDQKSLDYMFTYNKLDVEILEKVYLKLRPYIPHHPNIGVYLDSVNSICSACGSNNLEILGTYFTNSNKYITYRCKDCGAISRERYTSSFNNKKNLLISTN